MAADPIRPLVIESLLIGIPVMPIDIFGFYRLNFMVCMHEQSHDPGVVLKVYFDDQVIEFRVLWQGELTQQHIKSLRDQGKFVDFGAVAVALLLIRELTTYTAIEQSNTGTTIDYYLGAQTQEETLIFNDTVAYLEVTGILKENEHNTIARRLRLKEKRLDTPEDLPRFIAVVEFSRPVTKVVTI